MLDVSYSFGIPVKSVVVAGSVAVSRRRPRCQLSGFHVCFLSGQESLFCWQVSVSELLDSLPVYSCQAGPSRRSTMKVPAPRAAAWRLVLAACIRGICVPSPSIIAFSAQTLSDGLPEGVSSLSPVLLSTIYAEEPTFGMASSFCEHSLPL